MPTLSSLAAKMVVIMTSVNSLWPGEAISSGTVRGVRDIGQHWLQLMARLLWGGDPLPEPMLNYYQSHYGKQISVKFQSKYTYLHSRKTFENVVCTMAVIVWHMTFSSAHEDKVRILLMTMQFLLSATHQHPLTDLPLDNIAAISQTIFSDAFSWMKSFVFIKSSLKFVPKGPIDNNPALV